LKKKPKKQRARIKDLAEKYEFEAHIPKKGLEEKGKEPILKVGAVCCDCAAEPQKVCDSKSTEVRIVRPGLEDIAMPDGKANLGNAGEVVKFLMGELGFVKGYEKGAQSDSESKTSNVDAKEPNAADSESNQDPISKLEKQIEELNLKKSKAAADEDYKLAKELKTKIEKLEDKLRKLRKEKGPAGGSGSASPEELKQQIDLLKKKKTQATEDEDYKLAKELKAQIEKVEKQLKKTEL